MRYRSFFLLRITCLFLLTGLSCHAYGEDSTRLQQWKELSQHLLRENGKWVTLNSASFIAYKYSRTKKPHSIQLDIQAYLPGKKVWTPLQQLYFTWDNKAQLVKVVGTDTAGNKYSGESGKVNAGEISYDLVSSLMAAPASFQRFNQKMTDTGFAIACFKQEGDKWVFEKTMEFRPLSSVKID